VMMEHLDPRESGREELAAPRAQQQDPMVDREVPLESATMSSALHAWLDGEPVNEQELKADGKTFELWSGVQAEAGRRRRMTTPMSVPAQIMDAIKQG
jgi:hypothetical protein